MKNHNDTFLSWQGPSWGSEEVFNKTPKIADRTALQEPRMQELLGKWWSAVPSFPGKMDGTTSIQLLSKRGRVAFASTCPLENSGPRKTWASSSTWGVVRQVANEKKRRKAAQTNVAQLPLWHAFQV